MYRCFLSAIATLFAVAIFASCDNNDPQSGGWTLDTGRDTADAPSDVPEADVVDAPPPRPDAEDVEPDTGPPAMCPSTEEEPAPDEDGDCVPDDCDGCPGYPNFHDDGHMSVNGGCDVDTDGDGLFDWHDNCLAGANPAQADSDGDGLGDLCDRCPDNPALGNEPWGQNDTDLDCVVDAEDNCPGEHNPGQHDPDGDGLGDRCDNCPESPNKDQLDADHDCQGDVCDPDPDAGSCADCLEFCNGIDDDCDGNIDESCSWCTREVCDGTDNDCDGQVDNGCENFCDDGSPVQLEVCDGEDNDCDGTVDEGCCGQQSDQVRSVIASSSGEWADDAS